MTYIAARLIGGRQTAIKRIVIHGTSSACKAGGARGNASWFQNPKARGSAHYIVDPGEIVQCVPEDRIAAHAPPNTGSIGIELCDPNAGPADRWHDTPHTQMLDRAAGLVRDIAARHSVPLVWIDHGQILAGQRGITSHHEVTLAYHQSTHTDPVGWTPDLLMSRLLPVHTWSVIFPGHDDRTRGGHDVAEAQIRLQILAARWKAPDLDPGTVDGVYGPRSQAATRAFKRRIIGLQKMTNQDPWPNDDPIIGPATLGMLRWWTGQ